MAGHVLAKVTSKENSIDNVHIISSSFYGVCNSPANTANKEVIVANPNITNITLVKGMLLTIKFTFDNTVNNTSLTLFKNVGSEEIPLKNNNDTPLVSSIGVLTHEGENNTKVLWTAGSIVSFIYNGTNWIAMSSSNTARTDLSNVDNAWIQNGVIRNGVIGDAQIGGVSANKLTAGTIDASNIHVTNLRADNLIVTRMNGQPVIGGYTVVNSDAAGYEEMNPVERGWYEIQPNGTMVRTEDTEVDLNKVYYSSTSSSVALYDQNYINNMETELNNRIDGAIETFSGKEIPTEHNKPYTDWYDTTVSPVKDDRRAHVGDLYYVIGAYDEVESTIPGYINMSPVEQEWYEFDETNQTHILSEDTEVAENKTYYTPSLRNGYCYRFYEDSTTNAYSWVLIKDSDVTAALSSISELQNFNEQLSHWETATDEGVLSIKQKFTTLSGKVDDTITSAIQVWYTGTASPPSKPNQKITSTATTSGTWTTVIPDYNDNAPYYYYCWQYLHSDNACTHSDVIYDKTTTENQQIARDAAATANGAISGVDIEYISITSNTTPPSQEDLNWHSTITAGDYGDGLYIWQRTKTTTRTSISHTQPVCISGRDGQSAYIYSLTCNPSVIVKDNNGNFSPTAVAFSATRAQGTNTPVAYEGRFIIQESEDGSNWTTVSNISDQTNTTSVTYNTPTSSSNIKLLKGTLYMGGTAAVTPVDTQTVPIVTDGQNGQEGHDAYTVLLTNESHTFAANTSNALTASVISEVIAYKGATRVTASIGTIANTTTGVTAAIINNTNNTISPQFSVSVGSAVTVPQGIITIPVQVDGHNFEKQFAWALAFKGSEGKGIKSVTEYYALNNSTTAPAGNHSTSPSVWSTAIKTPTKDNKYVWNYEVITYTDNTTATPTTKHIAATYGETGAAGKSISNIVDYYQTTTNTTAPSSIYESTTTPNGWSITVQNPTSTNKYLWNYEQISYTDGSTPATTDPRIIGVYGDSGISATKIEEEYIKTNSSTNPPGDNEAGWDTTQPTWEPNYYIWTRSKITWSAPNPSMTTVTTPVLARGLNSANETAADAQAKANSALKSNIQLWTVNGGNGNTLNPGPSIPSAPTAVVTTTATTVTANNWTLAVPTYTPSLSYYYYCLQQERGDGQYQWTTPVYDPTTSDMMKTTSEIITFEQTTNKTITDTVGEQSTKITQLTNETKTIANPNLSPFFSHSKNDSYDANTNPKGYWKRVVDANSFTTYEMEQTYNGSGGWAHFSGTGSASNPFVRFEPVLINLKPSTIYTFIIEFDGTFENTGAAMLAVWSGNSQNDAIDPFGSSCLINLKNQTKKIIYKEATTRSDLSTSTVLNRGYLQIYGQGAFDCYIRISLFEGQYSGPYKPYVDQIGLMTLTNTVNDVKSTATANSSKLSQLVTTLGVNADGSNPDSEKGSFLYRVSEAEQTLDGFTSRVGRIEQNSVGWYAISSTEKNIAEKTAIISPTASNWTLSVGTIVTVKFNNENTAAVGNLKLNVNNTGEKPIKSYTKEALTEDEYKWSAGTIYTFVYDGTYWVMTNDSSRIVQAETQIQQTSDNVLIQATKTATTNSDAANSLITSIINVAPEGVKIAANKVEINGTAIFNSISPSINTTIESKGYITTTAANNVINEAINNLEIGGRNLLKNTSNFLSDYWVLTRSTIEDEGLKLTPTTSSAYAKSKVNYLDYTDTIGKTYTISWEAKQSDEESTYTAASNLILYIGYSKSTKITNTFSSSYDRYKNTTITSAIPVTWTKYSQTFTATDEYFTTGKTDALVAGSQLSVEFAVSGSKKPAYIRNIKLEAGDKATDWSPNPDEMLKQSQRIYYRSNNSNKPNSTGLPTSWITTNTDIYNTTATAASTTTTGWTKKVPPLANSAAADATKYPYLWTCEQYQLSDGTIGYTEILLDDSNTIIDGGKIITGSVTANQLNATSINASKMLTVGSMTTDAASSILNSNIIIGGKNLLGNTENRSGSTIGINSGTGSTFGSIGSYNDSVSLYSFVDYDGYSNAISCATSTSTGNRGVGWYTKVGEIRAGETYTFSCRIKCSIATNVHMHTAWRSGSATASYMGWTSAGTKAISADTWTDYSYTFVPASNAQLDWEFFVAICITGSSSGATYQVAHAKLEKGTKVTDWSPAPEELQSNAIKRTQRIYYRKSATGTPTAPASWVTSSSDGSNAWTQKHMSISNTDKYIYTCEQYEMADGRLGNTPILLDDTITVIDGGRITTGTIDASIATITNINADNITAGTLSVDRINAGSITLGKISNETQNLILNGVNLLRMSELLTTDDDRPDLIDLVNGWISDSTPSSDDRQYNFNNSNWKIYLDPGDYILSWEINEAISNSNSNIEPGIKLYKKEESTPIWESLTTVFNTIGTDSKTISLTETTSLGIMFKLYDSIVRFKLEKGTVATNWSLSPEDENINLSSQFENTNKLIKDNEKDINNIENLLDGYSYINENQEQVKVQGLITTVNGKLDAGYLKSWLYADENYLALGKTDPNTNETIVRAVLNSEALTFEKQGEPVATYGGEDGMNSPRAVIDDEFRVGNFMWVNKRSNHHVSFKYVGGTI